MELLLIFSLPMFCTVIVSASEGDKLRQLEKVLFLHIMEEYPEFASETGSDHYNDLLESYSLETFKRRKIAMENLLQEVYYINSTRLTRIEFLDLKILREHVQAYIDGYRWRLYGSLNPINNLEGKIKAPKWLYLGNNVTDYKYINRLQQLPKQIDEIIVLMKLAVELNRTNHISSMDHSLQKIEEEMYYFATMYNIVLRQRRSDNGRKILIIIPKIIVAFDRLKSFLKREYLPACRQNEGLFSLHNGLEYYSACLKFHLNMDVTPHHVHKLGLLEIRRIKSHMLQVMRRVRFSGTLKQFFRYIKIMPQFHPKSKYGLVEEYERLIYDKINPLLSKLFHSFRRDPIRVVPVSNSKLSTWGAYENNKFFVSVKDAEKRSAITMLPLTLHEANPGHHFQDSYLRQLNIPLYRKFPFYGRRYAVPFTYPTYSAYAEGWALYAEFLGEELGLFKNPYYLFGRYISEMFRACRLVVDTGIHAFGWSKEKSIGFLTRYTDFTFQEAASEVDRYIIWPGYACSYKIGELEIKRLRQRAQKALGSSFDVKEFHDQILKVGPVGLSILDDIINDWIQSKTSTATNSIHSQQMTYMFCISLFSLCTVLQNL